MRWATTVTLLAALGTTGCESCKKEEEKPEQVGLAPRVGGASADSVTTQIGQGSALDTKLAPTSTVWQRVVVIDDDSALLIGQAIEETIALRTDDGGATWFALKTKSNGWPRWGAGADGALVLADGKREKAARELQSTAPVREIELWFAGPDERSLTGPSPALPGDKTLQNAEVYRGIGAPAALSGQLASLVVDNGRNRYLMYGRPLGQQAHEPRQLPSSSFVARPYGRPAQLVGIEGGSITVRPWPEPADEKLAEPVKIAGFSGASARTLEELGAQPLCEQGDLTLQLVTSGATRYIVGIAPKRTVAFKVPVNHDTRYGCGGEAIVYETVDPKQQKLARRNEAPIPILVRCTFDGKCSEPQSYPFQPWEGKHESQITSISTEAGIVATMTSQAGTRWGAYLGQSLDGGKTFELARVIGEGEGERGRFEIGALVRFKQRLLLLISADVTGTSRRGWYVLASNDDGTNWGTP